MAVSPGIAFVWTALLYAVPRRNPAVGTRLARTLVRLTSRSRCVMRSVVGVVHREVGRDRRGGAARGIRARWSPPLTAL